MAAAGVPIPKKPLTIPDKKNVANINVKILGLLDGKKCSNKFASKFISN
jgi:hypothetical protein